MVSEKYVNRVFQLTDMLIRKKNKVQTNHKYTEKNIRLNFPQEIKNVNNFFSTTKDKEKNNNNFSLLMS